MYTDNNHKKRDKRREQQRKFIKGDNVVSQGGNIEDYEEPVEEKSDNINRQTNYKKEPEINPPLNPSQKTDKKIPDQRKHS
jgi:hypothetical protein